jgi:hypothetical protein
MQPYDIDFFRKEQELVLASARQVAPILLRLLNPRRPALWWLEHYSQLHQRLRERYRCVLQNERFVIFDLK